MIKYTVVIDGMQCSMCEAHINDAIRKAFTVKKVHTSHSKKQTVLVTENTIDEQALKDAINHTGYTVVSISGEPYEKEGFFSVFKH